MEMVWVRGTEWAFMGIDTRPLAGGDLSVNGQRAHTQGEKRTG